VTKRTIARRYAKAMLILAKKEGIVEQIDDEFSSLVVLMDRVKVFWQVMTNPLYDVDRRKLVLSEVARMTGMSPPVSGLLGLLLEKGRMKYLPLVLSVYHEMADEAMGRVRARVYTAMEPTSEQTEKIREKLARIMGKEVIVEITRDGSLLGGMVTKIGGLVFDGSLKSQLARMRESLARG